ncbi:putative polyribonucleotide nucleotidyltransferase [Dictyocaulus viviparus]|uniref:Putative polyribonucleotide nucleotidyltransferase n=1 Tax=Dictyocaulus viviparus TaxID=29172 RepID=A0A0D8XCW1_DICVI|nr:putative polyribonucleotide nucleotidyltransferase [Dictyocaulus viviparus]
MARFASGAVVASSGDNAVLSTCVYRNSSSDLFAGPDFVPLLVDFKQSAAAVGKIPTNYLRRELGQTDADILSSRLIDRSLRPLFPAGWINETQIVVKPLSMDDECDMVMMGLNAAAAALHLSSVPFRGPVGAVRVGLINDTLVVNPTRSAMKNSCLDLLLAGCGDRRTVMIDMDGKEVVKDEIEAAIDVGLEAIDKIMEGMNELRDAGGRKKEEELGKDVLKSIDCENPAIIQAIFRNITKKSIRSLFSKFLKHFLYKRMRMFSELILETNKRCDGRGLSDIRPITINIDVFKRLHGSSLFQRGQTQVISTVTFDSPAAAFHSDSISQILGSQRKKMFMLHYEFPSYATNEISSTRGVNRRELGHGALAEKALKHVIPSDFPYTVRLACQVLESNGSSSMASVCGGSLALLDAGVPISASVAGVAIGLVTDSEANRPHKVLTDILGIEDYAGDMDFKIAGSSRGFTAMQLDIKIPGLTREQLNEAFIKGRIGLDHVLSKMAVLRDRPRGEFKATVPVMESMRLDTYKRQILFRSGGLHAKTVEVETGVKISQEDDAHIGLFAPNKERLNDAKALISKVLAEDDEPMYVFGQMISAEVVELLERGAMLKLPGAGRPIFVPNSQLHSNPIRHSSASGLQARF